MLYDVCCGRNTNKHFESTNQTATEGDTVQTEASARLVGREPHGFSNIPVPGSPYVNSAKRRLQNTSGTDAALSAMSENSYTEITRQIMDAGTKLKRTLDLITKMRIECAELQLRMLQLYTPELLNVLESIERKEGKETTGGETSSK